MDVPGWGAGRGGGAQCGHYEGWDYDQHLDRDILISNLTLYKAGPKDKGNYTCSLPHKLSLLGNLTVSVHILNKTMTEPVHETGHIDRSVWCVVVVAVWLVVVGL